MLEAWRGGDEDAGNALVRRHFDTIYRFFRLRLDDGVADMVQRTFLGAVQARDRMPASFRAYLLGIAHKQLLMELRKRSRHDRVIEIGSASGAAASGSPSGAVLQREEQRILLAALRRMPLDQQILLELYYWEELDTADLAAVLDVPAGTVKSRLSRARARLRKEVTAAASSASASESTLSGLERWARSLRDVLAARDRARE